MSIEPRPEATPAMKTSTFDNISSFNSNICSDESEVEEALSTLYIDHWDYSDADMDEGAFLEAIKFLDLRKAIILKDILALKKIGLSSTESPEVYDDKHEWKRHSTSFLRTLKFSETHLDESGLEAVTSFFRGHSTLSSFSLYINSIKSIRPLAFKRFAQGLSMCNLRSLQLNGTSIGTQAMVQLLDNLDMPSLVQLILSNTMLRRNSPEVSPEDKEWRDEFTENTWKKEINRVGDSLVNIISKNRKGGHAPRLEKLSLNGNDLGWKTVKKIVTSILDDNKNLIEAELFGAVEDEDSEDEDESDNHQTNVYAFENRIVTQALKPSTFLTKQNWRGELGRHLWKNRKIRSNVKDASRYMLPIVRVLNCKSRKGHINNKTSFSFTSLPMEIRARIIPFLDDEMVLSEQQVKQIISFASNPATLGYGCKSTNLGLSDLALHQIRKELEGNNNDEDVYGYGLIPHHRWTWKEMMKDFPMPRDWPATVLDENIQKAWESFEDDHSETEGLGGGGGPDGRGGVTYERPGPDAARRRWLEEQSGLHAFWESTGTYREE